MNQTSFNNNSMTTFNQAPSNTDTYHAQGYLIVKSLFSPAEITALTQITDRIFDQWLAENRTDVVANQLLNMANLTHARYFRNFEPARLELFQILASHKLVTLLAELFGDGIYFHNTQLFFNPFDTGKHPYWHRDLQFSPIEDAELKAEQQHLVALHVRVPLAAEYGIELIPGTHQRWDNELERNVRLELNGHKNSEALPGALLIGLQPGDILLFDAQMLHRGNYRLNPMRKALDICLGKYHPYTAPYLQETSLPSIEEMARLVNNRWYRQAWKIIDANKTRPYNG